jgi:hypothetical protein
LYGSAANEALATGLKGRIAEMQDRLDRLQDCAAKRRQIAKDVMVELELKKITAPDFTVSIRPRMPACSCSMRRLCRASTGSRAPRSTGTGCCTNSKMGRNQRRYPPVQNRF